LAKGDIARMNKNHFGGKGGRRGSAMATLERAMVVSYRLSIVTIALSLTIPLQCHRVTPTFKSTRGGSLSGKIWGGSGRPM